MKLFAQIAQELVGMFIADARLTVSILLLVATAAVMLEALHMAPIIAGTTLLLGCLLILVAVVFLEAGRDRF